MDTVVLFGWEYEAIPVGELNWYKLTPETEPEHRWGGIDLHFNIVEERIVAIEDHGEYVVGYCEADGYPDGRWISHEEFNSISAARSRATEIIKGNL